MSFELTERIFAIAPQHVQTVLGGLIAQYGEALPDGPRMELTIGGHWDDVERTRIRAARLDDGTITPTILTDGRYAFRCLWQADAAAAFDRGEVPNVQQLTESELAALTPQPETP